MQSTDGQYQVISHIDKYLYITYDQTLISRYLEDNLTTSGSVRYPIN